MADVPSFWHDMLLPMYEDWRACPEKDHRAKALAQFINNMAERLALDSGGDPTEYRRQLRQGCPQFGLLYDLADSAKHVELRSRPDRQVVHIDQAAMSKMMDDWGKLSEVKSLARHQVLVVTDKDGRRHRFAELVAVVMTEMAALSGVRFDAAMMDSQEQGLIQLRQIFACLNSGAWLTVDQEWLAALFGPDGEAQQKAATAFAQDNHVAFRYEEATTNGVFGRSYAKS